MICSSTSPKSLNKVLKIKPFPHTGWSCTCPESGEPGLGETYPGAFDAH